MLRLLLCLSLASLAGCATTASGNGSAAETTSDPGESAGTPATQPNHAEPPRQTSILDEPLTPVRGGPRVLPPYRGPMPCKMALNGESPVARACSQGGQRQAVELMNTFVKRARAEGIIFECTDCHADEEDLSKLTPRAESEFRKLLFLARPAD